MDKPEPDGFIKLYKHASAQGDKEETILFKDISGYSPEQSAGLILQNGGDPGGYRCIPWHNVIEFAVKYNSDTYELAVREYQAKCEHVWTNSEHAPNFTPCQHLCVVCDFQEMVIHDGSTSPPI